MRACFALMVLLFCPALQGQYLFKGQVSEKHSNKNVYLSLVEDYRKTSRVYLDQIIQTTSADSLGYFSFKGNTLPHKNRIYRIHADGCEEGLLAKNHFLRECSATESLLFIANNRDTVSIPLLSGQAFCEVSSTNPVAGSLLEMEALKEEMIVDFYGHNSKTASSLHFENWFKKFQEFGSNSREPLVELCVYDFLSDRKNETYDHYLETVGLDSFYNNLGERLKREYPNSSFTSQFENELRSDQTLVSKDSGALFKSKQIFFILAILTLFIGLYFFVKKRKILKGFSTLTPQEQKIAEAIKSGKTNKQIATELFISLSTVKTHINNIYKKLGVTSRSELNAKF